MTIGIAALAASITSNGCSSVKAREAEQDMLNTAPAMSYEEKSQDTAEQKALIVRDQPTALDQLAEEAPVLGSEESGTDISMILDSKFKSNYITRGFVLTDGPANHTALDIFIDSDYGTTMIELWGNYDVDQRKVDEVDVWLRHSKDFGPFTGYVGFNGFYFPVLEDQIETMYELNVGAQFKAPGNPNIWMAHDVTGNGTYFELDLSETIDLSDQLSLTPKIKIGRKAGYMDFHETHMDAGATLSQQLNDNVSLYLEAGHMKTFSSSPDRSYISLGMNIATK